MSAPLNFAPKIDPEAPPWLRQHLTLIYQKLNNHTQAVSLLAKKTSGTTVNTTNEFVTATSGGGGGGGTSTVGLVNNQGGQTAYSTQAGDNAALVVLSDASPIAVNLTAQSPPWCAFIANQGASLATLTPASGTISYAGNPAAASMPLPGGYCCLVAFDGTNWWAWTEPVVPVNAPSVAHEWLSAYSATTGAFTRAQPAFTDISGTIAAAQLPTPTTGAIGGVKAVNPVSHEWVNSIDATGTPQLSQPAYADISGTPAPILAGTSGSLGGSAMTAGQTITATATITGAGVGMVAVASPNTYSGAGFVWDAYVSAAGVVTVRLTAVLSGTPTASTYTVRVIQ